MYIVNIMPCFTPTRSGGCPKNCSGQGDCSGDTCTCHPGYKGKDCSDIVCPNNCSQNGNCINDQCECFQDFKGQLQPIWSLTNKINHDWFVKVTLSLSLALSLLYFNACGSRWGLQFDIRQGFLAAEIFTEGHPDQGVVRGSCCWGGCLPGWGILIQTTRLPCQVRNDSSRSHCKNYFLFYEFHLREYLYFKGI